MLLDYLELCGHDETSDALEKLGPVNPSKANKQALLYERETGYKFHEMMPRLLAMLARHQFVYALDKGVGVLLRILDQPVLRSFVEDYFATAGFRLEYNKADMWAGIFPNETLQSSLIVPRIPKEQTILLLLCANIYIKDFNDAALDQFGCSECLIDELIDEFHSIISGDSGAFKNRVLSHIDDLRLRGIVSREKGLTQADDLIRIRPFILQVVSSDFEEQLQDWRDHEAKRKKAGSTSISGDLEANEEDQETKDNPNKTPEKSNSSISDEVTHSDRQRMDTNDQTGEHQ